MKRKVISSVEISPFRTAVERTIGLMKMWQLLLFKPVTSNSQATILKMVTVVAGLVNKTVFSDGRRKARLVD